MNTDDPNTYNPRHDYFDMEEAPPPLSFAQASHIADQVGAGLELVGIVGLPFWFCAICGACYHLVKIGSVYFILSPTMIFGFVLLLAAISGFLSAMVCFRMGRIAAELKSYPIIFACQMLTGIAMPVLGYFFGIWGSVALARWDVRYWFYRPAPHPSELEAGVPHQIEEVRTIEQGYSLNRGFQRVI